MRYVHILLLTLASSLLFGGNQASILTRLSKHRDPMNLSQFDDVNYGMSPILQPGDAAQRFLPDGTIQIPFQSKKGEWVIEGDGLLVNGKLYQYSDSTKSYFHPTYPGALFGQHFVPSRVFRSWAQKRLKKVIDTPLSREIHHFSMRNGGGHDTVIGLIRVGDSTSVPYLIAFLDRARQCSDRGVSCSVDHCVEALKTITSSDFGLCAQDWATGLHLSLEDCKHSTESHAP